MNCDSLFPSAFSRKKEPGITPAKFNREASRLGDVGAIKKSLLFYCPLPSVALDSLSIAT